MRRTGVNEKGIIDGAGACTCFWVIRILDFSFTPALQAIIPFHGVHQVERLIVYIVESIEEVFYSHSICAVVERTPVY